MSPDSSDDGSGLPLSRNRLLVLVAGLVVVGLLFGLGGSGSGTTPSDPGTGTPTPTGTATPPAEPYVTPAPSSPDPGAGGRVVDIALWGDTHWGNIQGDGAGNDIVDSVEFITARDPDYVFHLGDVTSDADPWAFERANENFSRVVGETGADHVWFTTGATHDGFADGASFKSADGGLDYGLGPGLAFMRERGRPSFLYTVEMGNTAFVTVPTYYAGKKLNTRDKQFKVVEPWRSWLESQLRYYDRRGYNVVVYSHFPLYRTNQWTEEWSGVGSDGWRETSAAMKRLIEEYSVDVYLSAHVHTDTDRHYEGGKHTKSGKIVNGSRYPDMVNTTYVSNGVINWEHGTDRVNANRPTMYMAQLDEQSNALVLRGYDVRDGTQIPIATGENGTDPVVEVPLDNEVDLGPAPGRPDGYRQGWMPVAMAESDAPYRDEKRFQHGGLSVRSDDDWWTSAWRYPYSEAVPNGVETTHNATALALDHEFYATTDDGTAAYELGTAPVDQFIVNTSVDSLQTREAFVADYTVSYRVVFEHAEAAYLDGTYVLGATGPGASVRINEETTVSRRAGVPYRVSVGATATVGEVTVTATDGPVTVLPRNRSGDLAAAFVHTGPEGTSYEVGGLADGERYAVRHNGTRSDVVTATDGRVTVETTAGRERIVVRPVRA